MKGLGDLLKSFAISLSGATLFLVVTIGANEFKNNSLAAEPSSTRGSFPIWFQGIYFSLGIAGFLIILLVLTTYSFILWWRQRKDPAG